MQAETQKTRLVDPILVELEQEAETTKRLLEIVPEDKLTWRPHPKSMSLGQLALHIATLQGGVAELSVPDSNEVPDTSIVPEPACRAEILAAFAEGLAKTKQIVAATDDVRATAELKITKNGETILASSRIGFWRSILLNHNYHHRGQLSVYLRELHVSLPSIYGPSADTNPFA